MTYASVIVFPFQVESGRMFSDDSCHEKVVHADFFNGLFLYMYCTCKYYECARFVSETRTVAKNSSKAF